VERLYSQFRGFYQGNIPAILAAAKGVYGKRFVVRAEEKLTAFLKLEAAIRRN
jgi:hypothetical protein